MKTVMIIHSPKSHSLRTSSELIRRFSGLMSGQWWGRGEASRREKEGCVSIPGSREIVSNIRQTTQPTSQSTSQSNSQPNSQSNRQPTNQLTNQPASQTTKEPTNQSNSQPPSQLTSVYDLVLVAPVDGLDELVDVAAYLLGWSSVRQLLQQLQHVLKHTHTQTHTHTHSSHGLPRSTPLCVSMCRMCAWIFGCVYISA